jgi:starch-binding outer membrane protein, SusD/RagB family
MKHKKILWLNLLMLISMSSCKEYLEIGSPNDALVASTAFNTDADVKANIAGLHSYNLISSSLHDTYSHFYTGFAADEIQFYTPNSDQDQFLTNTILPSSSINAYFWSESYKPVYQSNLTISALENKTNITPALKNEALGVAHFFRGLSYLNLSTWFGEVPLVLTSNVSESGILPRTTKDQVFNQIISDLKTSKNYLQGINKPNGWVSEQAATALLARAYLYAGKWQDALNESKTFISGAWMTKYKLEAIQKVFLRSSGETIFGISTDGSSRTTIGYTYAGLRYLPTSTLYVSYPLTDNFINGFEAGDLRKQNWTKQFTAAAPNNKWYAYKYKLKATPAVAADAEDQTMIRLAEMYLIYAEANAQLNNTTEAIGALNKIRTRAGLPDLAASLNQADVLLAVEKERRFELFLEYGHRWADLIRTGRADAVLGALKPAWKSTSKLFPVPQKELLLNTNLTQNPGY